MIEFFSFYIETASFCMELISLSRFILLAKIIENPGISEGCLIVLIQSLPDSICQKANLPKFKNTIYQTLFLLKKKELIEIHSPKLLYPTQAGISFYQEILYLLEPKTSINMIQSSYIQKKNQLSLNANEVNVKPVVIPTNLLNNQNLSQRFSKNDVIKQFESIFAPELKKLKLSIGRDHLSTAIKNLFAYWTSPQVQTEISDIYPEATTKKMFNWLVPSPSDLSDDQKVAIEEMLQDCWDIFLP